LPYLFAALRITAPMAVLTAMLSEWIAADEGLGYLIILSSFQFSVDLLWADIAVLTMLSVLAFFLVDLLERPFAWWRR
jgi:NitT/TauT family transport system permease protein